MKTEKKSINISFNTMEYKKFTKMINYYKWLFAMFFLIFSGVLYSEFLIALATAFLFLSLYIIPLKCIRKYDKKINTNIRRLIIFTIIVAIIISFRKYLVSYK